MAIVVKGARLIDGTGRAPVENAAVVIEGQRIRAVGPEAEVGAPGDATVIEAQGRTVLPGLMDLHVGIAALTHAERPYGIIPRTIASTILRGVANGRRLLNVGVTTVRVDNCGHHGIFALKEATRYKKPVFVKIAAVNNVAPIASGIIRAGADAVVLDGFRGGTGAAPQVIRDNLGIPIEAAIAAVDQRLREEGIRNWGSVIASGSIRSSGDVAKAIALGADAIYIGTAALVALGCTVCKKCYTGKCAWGIATQDPNLRKRLKPEEGAQRVTNLLNGWSLELKEILGALGLNAVEGLRGNRDRLRGVGMNQPDLDVLGVLPAGK